MTECQLPNREWIWWSTNSKHYLTFLILINCYEQRIQFCRLSNTIIIGSKPITIMFVILFLFYVFNFKGYVFI